MLVKNFYDLPQALQCEAVRPYFEILNQRRTSLLCKSIFDRVMAAGLLITLSPVFFILAIMIKRDSAGEVFFPSNSSDTVRSYLWHLQVPYYGKKCRIFRSTSDVAK